MLSSGLAAAPTFGGAGADQVALHVGKPAEYRQHQAPGADAGVGPRLGQKAVRFS
jgi:phosphate-selective porin